jgi:hypothetical protein
LRVVKLFGSYFYRHQKALEKQGRWIPHLIDESAADQTNLHSITSGMINSWNGFRRQLRAVRFSFVVSVAGKTVAGKRAGQCWPSLLSLLSLLSLRSFADVDHRSPT